MAGYGQNSGYGSGQTGWMANVFRANSQGEDIKSVGFYAGDYGVTYEIGVYDNVETTVNSSGDPVVGPVIGKRVAHTTGTMTYPGYHTATFPTPGHVTPGKNFSVVVYLNDTNYPNSGYQYQIAIQQTVQGLSDNSTAVMEQSYVSPDGITWTDLASADSTTSTGYSGSKVCVKAFGSNNEDSESFLSE
ncbi:MAG: lectin like domain-containing protein [Syntrophobacteraceae bacterium]